MMPGGEVCRNLVGEDDFGEVCFSLGADSCLLIDYNVTQSSSLMTFSSYEI